MKQIHMFTPFGIVPQLNILGRVTESLSVTMGCHIPNSPSLCLLGDISIISLDNTNSQLLLVALAIAKKTILMNWKSRKSIHIASWKNLLIDYISMESLSSSSRNTVELHPFWSSLITPSSHRSVDLLCLRPITTTHPPKLLFELNLNINL